MNPLQVVTIVGARPQFIKAAVVSRAIAAHNLRPGARLIEEKLVHTGQHFDQNMSELFFEQLGLDKPYCNLKLGGGTQGQATGRMLEQIEKVLLATSPDWVVVHGDTNSTLAGALSAVKLQIPTAHVEAGLRSRNRRMPEEINRVLTDHTCALLLAPTNAAVENLLREGIEPERIALVGDVMHDALLHFNGIAIERSTVLADLCLEPGGFILATVHRAENTDDLERLAGILEGLCRLASMKEVVLPLHPRTRMALQAAGLLEDVAGRLRIIEPVGYLDMLRLESAAALIATDSGGLQKEAYLQGVPCITLRHETEWVELVALGANILAGTDPAAIEEAGREALELEVRKAPLYGSGKAGEAIVELLAASPSAGAARQPLSESTEPALLAPRRPTLGAGSPRGYGRAQ
jgi:UDP-GlcNAc3NAcA epimerase